MSKKRDKGELYWESTLLPDIDLNLSRLPDLNHLKAERHQRDRDFLKTISTNQHNNQLLKQPTFLEASAIRIQRVFRGYLGRKKYIDELYDTVVAGEKKLQEQQYMQVCEGEILVESYHMERDLEDDLQINKNKTRLRNSNASLIQRAWREHVKDKNLDKQKSHICCGCNDDYPDLYEYYSKTKSVCFCCEEHRQNPDSDQVIRNNYGRDSNVEFQNDQLWSLGYHSEKNLTYLSPNFDVKLTFVDSYESDDSKPEVVIFNQSDDESYVDIQIESVVGGSKQRISNEFEPVVEATRLLKSLEIHSEHEKKTNIKPSDIMSKEDLESKSLDDLHIIIQKINNRISRKNVELVHELMIRDELYSHHEALLMDADDLSKKQRK